MDTATKTGIDSAKTASKRVVHKTEKATGDLIGNKIPGKITSLGKQKINKKKKKRNKMKQMKQKRFTILQKRDNKLLIL